MSELKEQRELTMAHKTEILTPENRFSQEEDRDLSAEELELKGHVEKSPDLLIKLLSENTDLIVDLMHNHPEKVNNALQILKMVNPDAFNKISQENIDAKTGLATKAAIESQLEKEVKNSERQGTPLSVAIFDMDKLKFANDNYGHKAGDEIIQAIADVFNGDSGIRRSDAISVGKYANGDEFFVVLREANEEGAKSMSERIQEGVSNLQFTFENMKTGKPEEVNVTLSGGIAEYVKGDTAESLTNKADIAMYNAKERRNAVVKYSQIQSRESSDEQIIESLIDRGAELQNTNYSLQ